MIEARRRSRRRGGSFSTARSHSVEATSRGEDALRTSGAVEWLFVAALARTRLRRRVLSARYVGDATGSDAAESYGLPLCLPHRG